MNEYGHLGTQVTYARYVFHISNNEFDEYKGSKSNLRD